MPTTRIPLLGLSRAESDTACKDGEMSQLINLRHKNGSLQPVYETKQVAKFLGLSYDNVLIHKNAGYEHWIGYNSAGGLYWFATMADGALSAVSPSPVALSASMVVENIEQMGNIIIVTNSDGIHYFFFKDGGYVLIPSLDIFNELRVEVVPRSENTDPICNNANLYGYYPLTSDAIQKGYFVDWSQTENLGDALAIDNQATEASKIKLSDYWAGRIPQLKSTLDQDHGWLYGYRFVRYAIKLYDGSYVMHSAPILISPPELNEFISHNSFYKDGAGPYHIYAYYLAIYKLKCLIPNLGDLSSLKGIISGIDIFMSQEISKYDYDRGQIFQAKVNGVAERVPEGINTFPYGDSPWARTYLYRPYDKSTFLEDLKDSSLFYKIHSIPIESFSTGVDELVVTKSTRDILPTFEQLPDDDFTHNNLIPGSSYIYNQRLHLGNIKTKLFNGFKPSFFKSSSSTFENLGYNSIFLEVKIKTNEGLKSVFSDLDDVSVVGSHLSPMISYPDSRAESLTFWFIVGGTYEWRKYNLTAHKMLNLAYFMNPTLEDIEVDTPFGGLSVDGSLLPTDVHPNPSGNDFETTPDKIKASRVSNPFYFAAENTYSAGAEVITMKSVNEAVSEGTAFGTHPLYVFTKDGIKLLQVGSGSVYYSNMIDGPREVCLNSKSVLSLKNGLLFASGRGLIYMNGLQTKCITEQLLSEFLDNLISEPKMQVALTNPKISTLNKYAENYSFEHSYERILEINQMAYNDREDEVLLLSENSLGDPLCYVWNVSTGLWHIATYKIKNFIKSYDELYYVRSDDASGMNIHNIKTQTQPMDALLVTRPMKIVPDVFKKLSRVFMRSQVRMGSEGVVYADNISVDGGRYQRLLVYGSNDTINWFLVGGVDHGGTVRSLGVKTSSASYKLFRFVYCGQPFQVSKFDCLEFDYIEVEFSVTMNNKLR